jgi:hypothetical protein
MFKNIIKKAFYKAFTFYISAYITLFLIKGFLKLVFFLLKYLF